MPDIVKEMQRYKTRPESFDTNKRPDIAKLVDVGKDFSDYDEAGHSTDGKTMQVQFTTDENRILAAIEDVNDNMNRLKTKEQQQNSKGAVNIGFYDVS